MALLRPGSPARAIVFGVLVDVGGSIAAGLLIAIAYSVALASSGASAEEIQRALSDESPTSWLSIAGLAVGFTMSFFGGFVCARIAAAAEMRWVSVVAAVSGTVSLLMGSDAYPFEWNALLALVGMGAVFAGGQVGSRTKREAG